MTDREFDIQVRNLLQQAEEPVAPEVWEGVAAGLDKRRRVIPLRFWGYGGAVAAAAAVALFVLLKPAQTVIPVQDHSNHSIFMSEAAEETIPEVQVPVVEVPQPQPRRLAQASEPAAPVAEAPALPVPETTLESAPEAPATPALPEAPQAEKAAPSAQEDGALLERLAFEEERKAAKQDSRFSFSAFGNIQSNQRGALQGTFRRFGAPSLNQGTGVYNESPEISFNLPFSVGIGAQYHFSPYWSVGVGIRYTNLQRTFVGDYQGEGFSIIQTDIDNQQHWLGVPVNFYYSFVNSGRWHVHAFAGASAEWLLDNHYLIHNSPSDIHYHNNSPRHTQWSGAVGLGLEFQLTPYLALYTDPAFRYFFATDRQPRSLRTIQPLRFDVEAGLRFSFGK